MKAANLCLALLLCGTLDAGIIEQFKNTFRDVIQMPRIPDRFPNGPRQYLQVERPYVATQDLVEPIKQVQALPVVAFEPVQQVDQKQEPVQAMPPTPTTSQGPVASFIEAFKTKNQDELVAFALDLDVKKLIDDLRKRVTGQSGDASPLKKESQSAAAAKRAKQSGIQDLSQVKDVKDIDWDGITQKLIQSRPKPTKIYVGEDISPIKNPNLRHEEFNWGDTKPEQPPKVVQHDVVLERALGIQNRLLEVDPQPQQKPKDDRTFKEKVRDWGDVVLDICERVIIIYITYKLSQLH